MRKSSMGKIVLDLPPDEAAGNPRNSEGAFLTLDNGRILFAYSRFKGKDPSDDAASDICMLESEDNGESFGNMRVILTCEDEEAGNIMSVSLMHMQNGDIGIFYLVREKKTRLQMYLRRSEDRGVTWSSRILCTPLDGFLVVNNDRVIRLSNGDILIPAACHPVHGEAFEEHGELRYFFSTDDGRTWEQSQGRCILPCTANSESGLQEPGVLELGGGIVWSFARTDLGRQYETFSMDYGRSWTESRPSRFTGPKSPLSMKRDEKGIIWVVWNPIPEYNGRPKRKGIFLGGRTPYVIAASRDNGRSFTEPVAFETEEDRGYCYCAIHFLKDSVLLAYCAGGLEDHSCLTRLRLRKISRAELEAACPEEKHETGICEK